VTLTGAILKQRSHTAVAEEEARQAEAKRQEQATRAQKIIHSLEKKLTKAANERRTSCTVLGLDSEDFSTTRWISKLEFPETQKELVVEIDELPKDFFSGVAELVINHLRTIPEIRIVLRRERYSHWEHENPLYRDTIEVQW
jgi:hypothetical protein